MLLLIQILFFPKKCGVDIPGQKEVSPFLKPAELTRTGSMDERLVSSIYFTLGSGIIIAM